MTTLTQEIKDQYRAMAGIYNRNLKAIKIQLSRQEVARLKAEYKTTCDNQLAKILMLKGIQLA